MKTYEELPQYFSLENNGISHIAVDIDVESGTPLA